ncbi:hypothetical protein M5D96_005563 [Drosophila gunungcola]|uniref:Huntingtin interacting protein 1 n=1 Tax=Drosophila gunungcola TaxID=103775 RepID=A0A9P9YQL8_9MUSC|nr:hypothetical protein M5D96_005563 [Drosophila gunungcola]
MATHAEKEFYHLNVSVSKALNGLEAPLKTKHARSIIIMIHKAKEAKTFWMIISRQPLMQNRFTAWKFSHLLHKVLREAHESSIRHSQSHKKMILEVGKMWGLLQDDIGCCIQAYSKLLATKLNFHDKNRMFPGSLNISFTELFISVDRDLNYCFQLCVEIFDYLEDIIALQLTIFSSMEKYRMSSMTPQGQCRLAPIVCLIQDSNALYDLSVRLMFKLHDGVPYDVVSGHRDRFHGLFLKLKSFYNNVRPLQYFKDLITVPELPDSSPNFKSQNDFTSYVPPVVHVPQEPDPVVEDLVDTNNHESEAFSQAQQQLSMLEGIISEKEAGIEQLSYKLVALQKNFDELQQSYRNDVQELQQNNTVLSNDLVLAREMCATFRMQNDDLEMQLNQNPVLLQKAMEEEEKHKLSSEKFNKLKTLYTKIRDEHIQLLREVRNLDKLLEIELREMDAAIDDAASKITDLLAKAREKDNQTNLEVNGKIVDACTTLMECVKALIQKSRLLQHEIVASQKGNATANDFYRRNSQWSDGLISASKSVAKAANYLVEAANKAIESESGKNFELIVAAQEIAACTTQMVIASKVKAERNSQKLSDLTKASRSVTQATGTLVATVKDCNSQLEQQSEIELSKLTPSQIKTMEMEIHVKVLETEQALQMQRLKLSSFRKEHYKNADY